MAKHVADADLKRFLGWIRKQDLELSRRRFGWGNPVLNLIDAVLSINRQYNSFVKPHVIGFREDYPNVTKLQQLKELIRKTGVSNFHNVWKYRHPDRVRILSQLVDFFIAYKKKNGFPSDLEAMRHWANRPEPFHVKGIALKTTQYLRMLIGYPTVKPDRHIHGVVFEALCEKRSDEEVIELVKRAASKLKVRATVLDNEIWKLKANKA